MNPRKRGNGPKLSKTHWLGVSIGWLGDTLNRLQLGAPHADPRLFTMIDDQAPPVLPNSHSSKKVVRKSHLEQDVCTMQSGFNIIDSSVHRSCPKESVYGSPGFNFIRLVQVLSRNE